MRAGQACLSRDWCEQSRAERSDASLACEHRLGDARAWLRIRQRFGRRKNNDGPSLGRRVVAWCGVVLTGEAVASAE